jgi:hypothetical protein
MLQNQAHERVVRKEGFSQIRHQQGVFDARELLQDVLDFDAVHRQKFLYVLVVRFPQIRGASEENDLALE